MSCILSNPKLHTFLIPSLWMPMYMPRTQYWELLLNMSICLYLRWESILIVQVYASSYMPYMHPSAMGESHIGFCDILILIYVLVKNSYILSLIENKYSTLMALIGRMSALSKVNLNVVIELCTFILTYTKLSLLALYPNKLLSAFISSR